MGVLLRILSFDRNSYIITEAIINFSKKLNRKTITEFIHNRRVYEIVKNLRSPDYSQGYYLGVPSKNIDIESLA